MFVRRLALTLALAAAPACGASPDRPVPVRPNVLLVTLDTTRADRLGRGFTPTLDRLAGQGVRFTQARTVVPLTLPAHASIMTGLAPSAHGLTLNGSGRLVGHPTIAARLQAAGYATRAVVGAFVLDRRFGLDAGFAEYDDRIARDPQATDVLEAERPANEVIDRALAMLDALPASGPWFLWVHLYDAHAPYEPPAAARARAGGDAYNGEIAFMDEQLARLTGRLDARQDAARTATIVVGDHGESLGEHGEATHGMLLFEPVLRVPLIIRAPGVAAGERSHPATVPDVAVTLARLTGLPVDGWQGRDLLGAPSDDAEAYSETDYPALAGWSPMRALVNGRWKVIHAGRPALFDLVADPGEQVDLSGAQPTLARSMAVRIQAIRKESAGAARAIGAAARPGSLPPDTVARLRSLGYVAATQPAQAVSENAANPASTIADWTAFEGALAATSSGHPAQALEALGGLTTRHPTSPLFAAAYARALAAAGKPQEALERFRRAVATWPGDWTLYHELAVLARDAGLAEEALRAELAALAIEPAAALALNGKGLVLADAGRHEEAAQAFESATREDPTNAVYLANLGNARRAMGDLVGAADAYHRALSLDARLGDASNGLGAVLVQQGRPADAVPWLEEAARDRDFVEAQLNLGIALQQAGDLGRAAAQYRKVIAAPARYAREREAAKVLLAQVEAR